MPEDDKKLDVFISYSRADAAEFVDELATALEVAGFRPIFDRESISAAENWRERLGALIRHADTVVFVITPVSVSSDICEWEIEEAIRNAKKIIPIEWLPTDLATVPPSLSELNLIFFSSGRSFAKGLQKLVGALEVDLEWVREHTRLAERAHEWAEQYNRDENALLVGQQLEEAEAWAMHRPKSAAPPTALQLEFIETSRRATDERNSEERQRLAEIEQAQEEREKAIRDREQATARLSRRTAMGLIAVAVLAVSTAVGGFYINIQRQKLEQASLRLQEGMTLKLADTDRMVHATEEWYRVATDYKLAIGVVRDRDNQPRAGSGFLVRGGSLTPDWGDEVLFLTAAHVASESFGAPQSEIDVTTLTAELPALGDGEFIAFSALRFYDTDLDVAVIELAAPPPRNALPIDVGSFRNESKVLDGIAVLHWTAADGFSLGFGHGIAPPTNAPGAADYYYTHVTGGGASGAPVFDANSGDLVCMHRIGITGKWGGCTSLSRLLATLRRQQRR